MKKAQPQRNHDLFEETGEPEPQHRAEITRLNFPNVAAEDDVFGRGAGAWVPPTACIICGDVEVAVLAPFTRNPYCALHWPAPA